MQTATQNEMPQKFVEIRVSKMISQISERIFKNPFGFWKRNYTLISLPNTMWKEMWTERKIWSDFRDISRIPIPIISGKIKIIFWTFIPSESPCDSSRFLKSLSVLRSTIYLRKKRGFRSSWVRDRLLIFLNQWKLVKTPFYLFSFTDFTGFDFMVGLKTRKWRNWVF